MPATATQNSRDEGADFQLKASASSVDTHPQAGSSAVMEMQSTAVLG